MNGIQGMLYLLEQSTLNEKQQHYADVASTSAKSLLTLIDEILDLSKSEAGKLTLDNSVFDVYPVFNELKKLFSLLESHNKDLEIVFIIDNIQNLQAIGDPLRLRQILINLIGNAIKFTKKGQIKISTELSAPHNLSNNKFHLTVTVQDTGIGIAKDNREYIFESFTQADSSNTRAYSGSGLGLAICKQLCELMDGEISLTSKEGVGSRFTFYITLQKVESE
jgi:signal transduction histidine kinase